MLHVVVLLCITSVLLFFFIYKYLALQKKYRSLLQGTKADAKVLFLQSKYASMGETVGNIAHQWKQPLNAIGSIQNSIKAALIFQGEISKEKLLYSVDTSFKLLRHLAETIDTFYSFLSQQNNARMSFSVAEELEKVRKITEYSFQNSNIALTFELEVNPTIHGNANEFTHAMLNIILNAKDAFDGRTVASPQIKVHVSEGNQRCIICINDNAGGIKLKPVEMVFELHITTKESGSGLGLFMTKNIIENRFGGKISASNTDQGACFTIELPYAQYGVRFADVVTLDEKITLERINKLSHKIIELEEVEKALKMWADIFKHARWGIAIYVEANQCFEMSNSAFESLYGYTAKEIQKLTPADFFTPDSLPFFLVVQEEALKQGYAILEALHRRKNGTTFPVSIELIVVKDETGQVLYVIFNIWDLTQRKEMEENLLLKEFALNKISEAVFLIDVNAKFHYVNEAACKSLGYTEDELLNMGVGDIDKNVSPQKLKELWRGVEITKSMSLETYHTGKDGVAFPIEISSNYFEYRNIGYNLATVRDISERLEVAKRKEDEKMRLFFERQIVGMAITSPKERWVQTNDKLCEILGYSHEELSRIGWVEITHPEDRECDLKLFDKIFSGEIDDYTLEKRAIRKDKEIIYINLAVSCVRHKDGSVDYILALIEDITQRKKAVDALHKSEALYKNSSNLLHSVMESSMEVTIFALDKEYKYLTFNEFHKNFYKNKYGVDIGLGKNFIELVPDKDFAKGAKNSWDRALSGESFSIVTEEETFKGGRPVIEYWNNYISPIFDDTKKIMGLTTFSINITKLREVENKLESLNATLEQKVKERTLELQQAFDFNSGIINAIPDLMFEVSTEGLYLNVWAKNEELLAAQKEMLLGNKISDVLSKEASTVAMEAIQEAKEKGLSFGKTLKIDLPKGTHWFELSASKKADGNIIFISRDVTERKQFEISLREREEMFRAIVENSPDVISCYDLSMRRTYVNPMMQYLLGKPLEEILEKTPREFSPLPDVEKFEQMFREVVQTKKELEHEGEYKAPWGESRWGNQRIVPMFNADNSVEGIMVIGRDMTERIETEKRLMMIETAINSSSEAVYINDPSLAIIYVNQAACNMLGYTRDELLQMNITDIDTLLSPSDIEKILEQKITHGQTIFQTKHRAKNGTVIDVNIVGNHFRYNTMSGFVSVVQRHHR